MLLQESVSVREIAWFVGEDNCYLRAIPLVPLHYRALQMQMNSILSLNYNQEEISDKYNMVLPLNVASKEDLRCQQRGSEMVGKPLNDSNGNTDSPTRPINNSTLRCIQPGLGSSAEWSGHRRRQLTTSTTWSC